MAAGPTLITGGAGFLGVHVARALADAGRDVRLLDLAPPRAERRHVLGPHAPWLLETMALASVDDPGEVHEAVAGIRPATVVHAAAIVDPTLLAAKPGRALRTNVGGTVAVLDAARLHGVARVVVVSSIGVLAPTRYEPVDGDHPLVLADAGPGWGFYSAAKVASEAFALAYEQCYGLDVRIVRPSAVYGLGMGWDVLPPGIVDGALAGEPVVVETGGALARDYTHVADVAELMRAVLDGPGDADRIFFGATGEPLVTGAEVVALVRELVPGARVEIGDELTAAQRHEARHRGVLSIANARDQLGWRPRYASLRDGLAQYLDALREYRAARGSL